MKPEYLEQLRARYENDGAAYKSAFLQAKADASRLTTKMRALLASAEAAADLYDWRVETALLGETDETRPYSPKVPEGLRPPPGAKSNANKNGSGPDQHNTENPGLVHRAYLKSLYESARHGAQVWENNGGKVAPQMMHHFLGGSGKDFIVNVSQMKRDMPEFAAATRGQADTAYGAAKTSMPAGYKGPVAFQTEWQQYSPNARSETDYLAGLGRFSYQENGVAYTGSSGETTLVTSTNIYDYYNWDTTDQKPWPQASDLGALDRAGMAQNFDSVGSDIFYRRVE